MPSSHAFYKEASQRLLSTLKIEEAWQACRIYLDNFFPADYLSLHLFDEVLGVVETVLDASDQGSHIISKKTTLTQDACQEIQQHITHGQDSRFCLTFVDCLSNHAFSKQLGLDLKTPDASCMAMDLAMDGHYLGFAAVTHMAGKPYTKPQGDLLLMLQKPFAISAAHFYRHRQLDRVLCLLDEKSALLGHQLIKLQEEEIIGANHGLKKVMTLVEHVAGTDSPVLLTGETGVGKEIVARALHRTSSRCQKPFIKVNCGAIAPTLLESELFGHEKGAFTGATTSRMGYFEMAEGGTIFLDEIGELTLQAQVRFLRILQDKEMVKLGGHGVKKLDIRVVAATNRNLKAMMKEGAFRQDLYFRLNIFPIAIPPLRERKGDIPALAYHFLAKKSREMALPHVPSLCQGATAQLMDYPWPGNVRELENRVEREIIINREGPISFEGLHAPPDPPTSQADSPQDDTLELDQMIINHIKRVMKKTRGKVEGKGGAAELLGVNPRTLQSRMRKMKIPFGRKAKGIYR